MSGQGFYKSFYRRDFLQLCALVLAAPLLNACNFLQRNITLKREGANAKTGHLLRDQKFPEPKERVEIETLIIGGGIAGLTTARHLKKNNYTKFILLELDSDFGGNSKGSKNSVTDYPLGAHYLPIPDNSFTELIDFLHEHNIITGFDAQGLPVYNEYFLCFEPSERLYFKGTWMNGLPPEAKLSDADKAEMKRFSALMEDFKNKTGTDGKPAFTIPLEKSSSDAVFQHLDTISMNEFLVQEQFKNEFIYWYINYCCKDDFGTGINEVSAWAGIHYFASRNATTANANSGEVLTWPEGNYFLVKLLKKELDDQLKLNSLAYKIEKENGLYTCLVFDTIKNESVLYQCKNIVLATPQYVNKHLLGNLVDINWSDFNYYPWLVANITVKDKTTLAGTGVLSWDNVIYNSKSLGYVNACHQKLNVHESQVVLTYYYNFSEQSPKDERTSIYDKDDDYWKSFIINDLKIAHPQIEDIIDEISIQIWGHGMISPITGFRKSEARRRLSEGFDNIYFTNSDVSGISIFEQAFYRGSKVAEEILNS
jgi:hypothetical protein